MWCGGHCGISHTQTDTQNSKWAFFLHTLSIVETEAMKIMESIQKQISCGYINKDLHTNIIRRFIPNQFVIMILMIFDLANHKLQNFRSQFFNRPNSNFIKIVPFFAIRPLFFPLSSRSHVLFFHFPLLLRYYWGRMRTKRCDKQHMNTTILFV